MPMTAKSMTSLRGLQTVLRLGDEFGEGGAVPVRQVGQDLAVDRHPGAAQAADQPAVRDAVGACRRVDAGDPQAAEVALADPAIMVGLGQRPHDVLVGHLEPAVLGAVVPSGQLENLLVASASGDSPFDPCHVPFTSLSNCQLTMDATCCRMAASA